MVMMTHAKFHFNRLMLTLIFGIWASEAPPLEGWERCFEESTPCSLKSGRHYTVIWSAAVQYLIYLARDSWYRMKHKLNPISVLLCEIHQILYKHQSKQLFYHSFPNFSNLPSTVIRSNYKQVHLHNDPYSSFSNFVWKRGLWGKMAAFSQ